jgi:hypothetical protein
MAMPGHPGISSAARERKPLPGRWPRNWDKNIRVLCVRSHAIADAVQAGSYVGAIFAAKAQEMGITVEQFLAVRRKAPC